MRALLVNQYFPPDTSATAAMAMAAAQALVRRGHEVTAVAGRPSYNPTERRPWRAVDEEQVSSHLRVIRVGSTTGERSQMTARVANYLSYSALASAVGMARRADVVLAMTDPPFAGALGLLAAKTRARPLVYWVQDLHPDVSVAAGIIDEGAIVRTWRAVQRVALRKANVVVVLGDDMGDCVLRYGVEPSRVAVVRSGAPLGPEPQSMPSIADEPVVQTLRKDHQLLVVHAGNLGYAGAWQTVLDAAAMLSSEATGFAFVGSGAMRGELEARAAGLDHVAFHDYRPSSELPLVLAAGDLHLVSVRRGLEGLVVPSKLYGVLAAGRPVLALADERADVTRLVRKHGCGLVADPEDPGQLATALRWARANPGELAAMGQRARNAARSYEREVMLDRLVEIIESAVGD